MSFFFFLSRSGWELLWRVVCVCCVDFLSGGERLGFKAPQRRGLGFGQCEDSSSVHLFCHPFFLSLLLLFIVMMMCFRCDLAPVVADRWWSGVGVHYPSESCRKKVWIGFATVEQMFFFVVHCHHHHGRRGNHDCGRCVWEDSLICEEFLLPSWKRRWWCWSTAMELSSMQRLWLAQDSTTTLLAASSVVSST